MNKAGHIVRNRLKYFIRLSAIILFLGWGNHGFAQTYPVWVNAMPPTITSATVYLGDFAHIEATGGRINFQIELRDPVEQFRQVHFRLTIIRNGTTVMMTDPLIAPPVLTLQKGFPVMVNGADLAFYFDLNHLVGVSGYSIGNVLPEDYYSICIEVVDYLRQEVISERVCASGFLNQLSPPLLYFPQRGEPLSLGQSVNLMFNWQLTGISVLFHSNISYIFELRELAPGLENTQEYFENNTLIYQTEVQNNSLIYGVGLPALVKDKRYIWRVRALARDATGQELVGYFHNNGVSEIFDFTLPEDLGKDEDFCHAVPPKPARSQTPIAQVFIDDVIQVGHFEMVMTDVQNASGDAVRGSGKVLIPFLDIEVETTFDNLKVNEKYEAYGGALEVTRSDTWLNKLTSNPDGSLRFDNLGVLNPGDVENITFLSRKINEDSPNRLPLSLKETLQSLYNVEMPYDLIIQDMRFTPQGASFNAVMMVPNGNGQYARFGTSGIGIDDSGFDIEDLKLFLSEHTSMPAFEFDTMHIIASPGEVDPNKGSYIEFDCKGFLQYNLQARYRFSKDMLARASNVSVPVSARLHIESEVWGETLAKMTMQDFAIQGLRDWRFEVLNGYVDFSNNRNLSNMQLPDAYVISDNRWKGFYITDVKVTLPQELKFGQNNALEMLSRDMIIDQEGVSFSGEGYNLMALGNGNAGGWGLSFEELKLNIAKNTFEDAEIKGQIISVPIVDTINYNGRIFLEENTGEYALDLVPREDIDVPFLNARVEPDAESVIAIRKEPPFCVAEWRPYADINGPLHVIMNEEMFLEFGGSDMQSKIAQVKDSLSADSDFEFDLAGVEIKGFKINHPKLPEGRYFGIDRVSTSTGGASLADVEMSLEGVDLLEGEFELDGKQPGLGLGFHVSLDSFGVNPRFWALNESEKEAGPYSMTHIELEVPNVPKKAFVCNCHDTEYCHPPEAHRERSTLAVGSVVQLGHFDMVVETLTGNNGSGYIAIPFLGKTISVDFTDLEADKRGMMSSGLVKAIQESPQSGLADDVKTFNSNNEKREFLSAIHSRDLNAEASLNCPISINQFISELQPLQHDGVFDFVMTGIQFESDRAFGSFTAFMETPEGEILQFNSAGIELRPNGFNLDDLRLYLATETTLPIYHGRSVRILAGNVNNMDRGSYIEYNCDGFSAYHLKGVYTFDKTMITSADQNALPVEAHLDIVADSWNDFKASVQMQSFAIVGLEGWQFEVQEAGADLTEAGNFVEMLFPETYQVPNAAWQGFWISKVRVTMPEKLKFGQKQNISFEAEHLIIDQHGVSGTLFGRDILSFNEKHTNRNQLSVDEMKLNLHHNQFTTAEMVGEIVSPAFSGLTGYRGEIYVNPSVKGLYTMNITPTYVKWGGGKPIPILSNAPFVSLLQNWRVDAEGNQIFVDSKPAYDCRTVINPEATLIVNLPKSMILPLRLPLYSGGLKTAMHSLGITAWGTTTIQAIESARPGVYIGTGRSDAYTRVFFTQSNGL